jgi:hypothetical protein
MISAPSAVQARKARPREGLLRGCRGALSVRCRLQAVTRSGSPSKYRPMPDSVQPVLNEVQTEAILRAISADRFETYLKAAGHDPSRALRLYLWNAQLGEAFHLPIQAVEVGLRNCINTALTNTYGKDWWRNSVLEAILDEDRRGG